MKLAASCRAGGALLLCAELAFAVAPNPTGVLNVPEIEARKVANANGSSLPDPIYINQGGDTIATATVIPGIPYSDAGSTVGYASNYESCVGCFDCPYSSTGGRDVVYAYSPPSDTAIDVGLCTSSFDTKVYIVDGAITNVVACSDDECGNSPPVGWKSLIHEASLLGGHTYYIIVDGYGASDAGEYILELAQAGSCQVPCPPGALFENEPVCYDGYVDSYNAGCYSEPPTFVDLPCSAPGTSTVVCGTYGNHDQGSIDMDWYRIFLDHPATITWCVTGEAETLVGIVRSCPSGIFYDHNLGSSCQAVCVSDSLQSDVWALYVSTPWGAGWPCGGHYVATLTGYSPPNCSGPVAVEATSWGELKSTYR